MLMGLLALAFEVRPAAADASIYILPDGSVTPSTASIQRNGDMYVLTDDIIAPGGIAVERSDIVLDGAGHIIQGGAFGIDVFAHNVTIENVQINGFALGVIIEENSSNDRVLDSNVTWSALTGIMVEGSCSYVSGNHLTQNNHGIDVVGFNNVIEKNDVTDNNFGILLAYGSNNTLRTNRMTGNFMNFGENYMLGVGDVNTLGDNKILSSFINDVDSSNTVDGKPIYLWINKADMTVPVDAGYVALVNCTRIVVKNLNLTSNVPSLDLVFTTDSTVTQNNITGNSRGVRLVRSCNIRISENEMTGNGVGIYLLSSDHIEISRNRMVNNANGIMADGSSYNTIFGNSITQCHGAIWLQFYSDHNFIIQNEIAMSLAGIDLYDSSYNLIAENRITNSSLNIQFSPWGNTVFHNNFVNSPAFSIASHTQAWDDGYPSGGNYWSDYQSTDQYTGPGQNMSGSDGIWDAARYTPYGILDRYPLVNPWKPPIPGDMNKDNKVDVKDLALVATAFGSYSWGSKWNVLCDVNQDGKVDIKDLVLVAQNFGKTS